MNEVVIVDAVRTPIGSLEGSLKSVRADDLAALTIRAVLERTGVDPARVDTSPTAVLEESHIDTRTV